MVYLITYTLLNMYDTIPCSVYHFSTKEKAENWAILNGYRVVENPDSDGDCTIEFVSLEA